MKVENGGLGIPPERASDVERSADQGKGEPRPHEVRADDDQVEVSSGAKALHNLVNESHGGLEIRQAVVARMRELLERGELGQDSGRLADAIIDRWLTTPQG